MWVICTLQSSRGGESLRNTASQPRLPVSHRRCSAKWLTLERWGRAACEAVAGWHYKMSFTVTYAGYRSWVKRILTSTFPELLVINCHWLCMKTNWVGLPWSADSDLPKRAERWKVARFFGKKFQTNDSAAAFFCRMAVVKMAVRWSQKINLVPRIKAICVATATRPRFAVQRSALFALCT